MIYRPREVISAPVEKMALLFSMLELDAKSAACDPKLRKDIRAALKKVRRYPDAGVTRLLANVSTGCITIKDCELIMDIEAPNRLATLDGGYGAIFYMPGSSDDIPDTVRYLKEFGFSARFRELFATVYKDGYHYIKFDADADPYPGFPDDLS